MTSIHSSSILLSLFLTLSIYHCQLNLTHSPLRESMTGTLTFEFSIDGKVQDSKIVVGLFKRTHEIASFVKNMCNNTVESFDSEFPSYADSPVDVINSGKYFETGKIVLNSNKTDDGSDSVSSAAGTTGSNGPYIFRKEGWEINTDKLRTKHSGSVATMVLDSDEFYLGIKNKSFPLNSRIAFTSDTVEELDQKNVAFGFVMNGLDLIEKITSSKLLGYTKPATDIKMVRCYDAYHSSESDL